MNNHFTNDMQQYHTIVPELNGQVVTLWLSRPDVHNALNDQLIGEISDFFSKVESDDTVRIIILRGTGKSFCSGADISWMKQAYNLTEEENLDESKMLSRLFSLIFKSSKVVIAAVHGNAFGGGCGLVAVSDLAYCVADTKFSLSETRIGLAAASITPYLLNKVPPSALKELIFTARIFDGSAAFRLGLVNQVFETPQAMDLSMNEIVHSILSNGKQAIIESKKLLNRLTEESKKELMQEIPGILARIRISEEAREGFSAFLEKRKPKW